MSDLFTVNTKGRIAIHKATNTMIIILGATWYQGQVNYDCVVPQRNGKQPIFCNATYSSGEVELTENYII